MKKICIIAATLLLQTTLVFSGSPDKMLHKLCLYPTILIDMEQDGHGTGVIIQSRKVGKNRYLNAALTCEHVVAVASGANIKAHYFEYNNWSHVKTRKEARVYVYAVDTKKDLAIIYFMTSRPMHTATIDFGSASYVGDEITAMGCANREPPRLTQGKVTGVIPKHKLRSSVPVIPGDSGGPAFHEYELMGIIQSISSSMFHNELHPAFQISQIIPIISLKDWNKEENGSLETAYNLDAPCPKLPLLMLSLATFEDVPVVSPVEDTPPAPPAE